MLVYFDRISTSNRRIVHLLFHLYNISICEAKNYQPQQTYLSWIDNGERCFHFVARQTQTDNVIFSYNCVYTMD